jgi:hypothetical protein
MTKAIENALAAKLREHAELTRKEAMLSLQAGHLRNRELQQKKQGDRKLVSQRITRVLKEIEGLASILMEANHEPQPA